MPRPDNGVRQRERAQATTVRSPGLWINMPKTFTEGDCQTACVVACNPADAKIPGVRNGGKGGVRQGPEVMSELYRTLERARRCRGAILVGAAFASDCNFEPFGEIRERATLQLAVG